MACCVVLTRLPPDVLGDDSAENSSCTASTGPAPKRPNLVASDTPSPGPGPNPGAGSDTVADHGSSTKSTPDFKEPWSQLLSLAKQKSRARHGHSKTIEASNQNAAPKNELQKVKRKKAADSDNDTIPNGVEMLPATSKSQVDKVMSVNTPPGECRTPRTSLPVRKSRRRALSVEWDYSGSESADTPPVPLNKRKTAKRRKRDASIEMDWTPDKSDSDAEENEFDAMHECSICNKKFQRPWRLRIHLQKHLNPEVRPFKCDEDGCSKGYFYKTHLERHKSRSHSDLVIVSKSMCPSKGCNRIFESQSGLKRHINKIHSVENLKFHCPHCDKKFSKNRQLRFHIAEHDGNPPLRCEKCNAGVFSDKDLKRHMRTHKEYPCDVPGCDKVFSKYPAFQKHKAEHNKCFQSLKCAHCNRQFKKKSDLRNHVLTHMDQRTIFQCTYDSCPRFYYQERNLRSHIRVYHEKTSNFTCSWEDCEMQFLSKRALARHLNFHENGRAEMKRKEGPRAPRKDKGKPKRAMATQLAGMCVHRLVEKTLLAPDRKVEVCEEENPDIPSSTNNKCSSRFKRSKSMKSSSTSVTRGQDECCRSDPVDIVIENNVILQDESGTCPLPIEESDSIISSLTGKFFEIGEDGVLIEVENTLISDGNNAGLTEENVRSIQACPDSENICNDSSLPEKEQNLGLEEGVAVIDSEETPLAEENIPCQETAPLTLLAEKENGPNTHSADENVIEVNESYTFVKSKSLIPSCERDGSDFRTVSFERLVTPTTAVYESGCNLSATLCAETIVDGPHGESEAILLIPGQKLSAGEDLSATVVKVLSGNMKVYSVAGKNANDDLVGSSDESPKSSPVKRVSLDDPSVTSILQPLLQEFSNKSGPCTKSVKNTSKPAELIENPAHIHNVVRKLAKLICANPEKALKTSKCKRGRSLRDNLQGPTQEATHSDSSSVSESDDSHSDSGSDDDQNDYNENDADDNLSSDGDGGNEDDEDGDDEDEVDEQPDDEDADGEDDDEEDNGDDNDENGNDGAAYLNGNDDNNNDNNESNSEGSEEQRDPDSTSEHHRISDGSDLGIDRASSPKQNPPCEDDDVSSTHSGDLIIDVGDDENEKDPAEKESSQKVEHETATIKSPPQLGPSPEKDYSKVRRRSSRLMKLEANKTLQGNGRAEMKRNAFTEQSVSNRNRGKKAADETANKCKDKVTVGKENEVDSIANRKLGKKQRNQPVITALKRKKNTCTSIVKEKIKVPEKMNTGESDSSGSDIITPSKKRRCNIGDDDDDSDSSVPQKISGNLSSPLNTTVKEETEADLESSQDIKSQINISFRAIGMNLSASLQSSPLSPSQDPLSIPVKNEEKFLLTPKTEARISIGCSQLSEEAWIRVLCQASKLMKLSATAAKQ